MKNTKQSLFINICKFSKLGDGSHDIINTILWWYKKNGEKTGKTGENTLKNRRKKQEKSRRLQEIQKQDLEEVPGNAENGNKFSTRSWEMLKTETRTKTRSSGMSRNDD